MTDYEYYLQNKGNINTVNIKQLKVDKELSLWDYQYIYDIADERYSSIIKCGWVVAIISTLIAFIILSYNEVDSDIMIFVMIFTILAVIICTYVIALLVNIELVNVDNIKIFKIIGVLINIKGDKAYIYNKEQNIVVKVNYFNPGWHELNNISLGTNMVIYKMRNRYICTKEDNRHEGSEDNKDNI